MEHIAEYAALISNREQLYRFLGRIYKREADQILFDQIKDMKFPAECGEGAMCAGYRMIEKYVRQPGHTPLTELAVDYARVFLGAGIASAAAAYPYESVYTSPKRLMMQEARDQVLEVYHANGLRKVETFTEPEDHIALELEFMAHLCHETQQVLRNRDWPSISALLNAQLDFLTKHLLNWTPAFCADIEKYAATAFYQGIGTITKGYLGLEQAILADMITEAAV